LFRQRSYAWAFDFGSNGVMSGISIDSSRQRVPSALGDTLAPFDAASAQLNLKQHSFPGAHQVQELEQAG
jgi:hypothetical protein